MTLKREAGPAPGAEWPRRHAAGLVACGLGLIGLGIAAYLQFGRGQRITDFPDPRVTVPFLIATLAAAITSLARREGRWQLPVAGIAMAASALALGWLLVVAIVAAVAVVVIAILSAVT